MVCHCALICISLIIIVLNTLHVFIGHLYIFLCEQSIHVLFVFLRLVVHMISLSSGYKSVVSTDIHTHTHTHTYSKYILSVRGLPIHFLRSAFRLMEVFN